MVQRLKRQKFEGWWNGQRARWSESTVSFALSLGFGTNERMARIYRAVQRRREKDHARGTGFQPWHATHLHSQYRRKRRGWK